MKMELEHLQVALRAKLDQLVAARASQQEIIEVGMEMSLPVSPAAKSAPFRREKVRAYD